MYCGRVGAEPAGAQAQPPGFLQLAGHPVRWRLLSELARSDRRVHEMTGLVGEAQNAVSYHPGPLRAGGPVSLPPRSAHPRDAYYPIALSPCAELLAAAADALHPRLLAALPPAVPGAGRQAPVRVLFLCTGNGSRSQIAEALLQQAAGDRVQVVSAGSHPKELHPDAVRVMRGYGIDLSGRRSKHLSEFSTHRFDYVITLCDRVRPVCPEFPGGPEPIHWSIPHPAAASGGRARTPPFQPTAPDPHRRLSVPLPPLMSPPTLCLRPQPPAPPC